MGIYIVILLHYPWITIRVILTSEPKSGGQVPHLPSCVPVQVLMKFGDTEIMATAVDLSSGNAVSASVDFFTDRNPKYCTKL